MDIVIISCKATKFEDITVTSQENIPKIPDVLKIEIKQINRTIKTHLKLLKM
jgi:hypothetical protein